MSQDEEAKQATWARRAAEHIVDGMLATSERLDGQDQMMLMREIARRAIWHMPNSSDELRELRQALKRVAMDYDAHLSPQAATGHIE